MAKPYQDKKGPSKFYLVHDQERNCCLKHFAISVERVFEWLNAPWPILADAEFGYLLIDNGTPIFMSSIDNFDSNWRVVEEKDFDMAKLVKKSLPHHCKKLK